MRHSLLRLSVLALLLMVKMAVFGQSFWIDDIRYEVLPESEKTVKVIGVDYSIGQVVTVPDKIEYEGITYQVSEIASMSKASIKKITLPNSIKAIGCNAFRGCTNLESINLPNNIISIGGGAFEDCEKLESVILPSNISIIESGIFDGCKSL